MQDLVARHSCAGEHRGEDEKTSGLVCAAPSIRVFRVTCDLAEGGGRKLDPEDKGVTSGY
ncbi:MAG TPA: hypothetical protein GXZ36_03560 [Firmicutes bacterium]|nr:hypothetical protein [Bacillota bacterium]